MKAKSTTTTTTIAPYDFSGNFSDPYTQLSLDGLGFLFENPPLYEFFGYNTLAFYNVAYILDQIYEIASFLSFFINLFHFFILTRKELRSNVIYMIMIGVCLSDIFQSLATMLQVMMTWNIVYRIEPCWGAYKYSHVMVNLLAKSSQIMSRRCSSFLTLYIALIRAFAILFPLSGRITNLMKPKFGVLVMLCAATIFGAWSALFAVKMKFKKLKKYECDVYQPYPSYPAYEMIVNESWEITYYGIDGYIAISVCLAYIVVALILVGAIRKAKQRSMSLATEKSTNTTLLIVVMAVTMFISEITYGSLYLFNLYIFQGHGEQAFLKLCDVFGLTLQIFNSGTHCFMCFCMSSQYRSTVKGLFWRNNSVHAIATSPVVKSQSPIGNVSSCVSNVS